jgi:hypothetical protein
MNIYLFHKLFLFIFLINIISPKRIEARIKLDSNKQWQVIYSDFKEEDIYIAKAYYTDSIPDDGWDKLAITTNSIFNDELQAEAAGRLEGELTKERIYSLYLNLKDEEDITEQISYFLQDQENFIYESIKKEGKNDPMIYNAYLIKIQYNAMIDQYNLVAEEGKKLNKNEFNLLNYYCEIFDLTRKFNVEANGKTNYTQMSVEELHRDFLERTHCSALFKIKNDLSDIFFGHNTWNSYFSQVRIIKEYNFNFNNRWVKSKNIIFTSYPATLSSLDDFYLTSNGLVVIETTNPSYNDSLLYEIFPQCLFTCERAMIANRISGTSKEWAENFVKYNSGTYNNQFMILDRKKVNLTRRKIDNDAFYIVEQLPNFTKINNVTNILKYGYWSSFNVPFDKEIYSKSMIKEIIEENPEMAYDLDYDTCSRNNIFRREQNSSDNLEGFKNLMRFNKYTTDPYSFGKASLSIASRGDLDGVCMGAYDAKVGVLSDFQNGKVKFHLIGGPTYNEKEGIEPFSWSKAPENCSSHAHEAIAESPNYEWIEYNNEFPF